MQGRHVTRSTERIWHLFHGHGTSTGLYCHDASLGGQGTRGRHYGAEIWGEACGWRLWGSPPAGLPLSDSSYIPVDVVKEDIRFLDTATGG